MGQKPDDERLTGVPSTSRSSGSYVGHAVFPGDTEPTFDGGELCTEDLRAHRARCVRGDGEQPVADRAQQLNPTAFRVHDQHFPHSKTGVEADLLVGLVTLGPDLDDQLRSLDTALGSMLGTAIELVRNPVVVRRAKQADLK
jgi:hypothetical protein